MPGMEIHVSVKTGRGDGEEGREGERKDWRKGERIGAMGKNRKGKKTEERGEKK